jgi:GNAT superfamily N-acetyltransferase
LTHALGLGLHGPVTDGQIAEVEHFFQSRGAAVAIDLSPHADPSLRDILSSRGYRISDMSNVLVRLLPVAGELAPVNDVQVLEADEPAAYAWTISRGFFGRLSISDEEFQLGLTLFHMPCSMPLVARQAGELVGGCGISIRNGVANFFADATLPAFRGRGVHSAMIRHRLRLAGERGCTVATAGTQPGSRSQSNYQKLGFEVAYTKITMVLG